MKFLFNANIKFDRSLFQKEYDSLFVNEKGYSDKTGAVDWWRVIRHDDMTSKVVHNFTHKVKDAFELPGKVDGRFYRLVAGHKLPWHQDRGTQCSFNFVINGSAPCWFKDEYDNEYRFTYEQSLFNTQAWHSVEASDTDRLLFKVSIFDIEYLDVVRKVLEFRTKRNLRTEIDLDKNYEQSPSQ